MNKILFIGCNINQLPYLKNLSKMGFKIIGTDQNKNAPGRELCDKFYQAPYTDYDLFLKIGLEEDFCKTDKIFTASSQFAHLTASIFAKKFGINYPSEKNINIILDKKKFYNIFEAYKISIPKTKYVYSSDNLLKELSTKSSNHYLKSDFSKNPKYVYKLEPPYKGIKNIFWGRDRYLRNCYVLQEEFIGRHLRLNIYDNNFILFDFYTNQIIKDLNNKIKELNIFSKLINLIEYFDLKRWVVKFDLIVASLDYVVLDIGIDPPTRMKKTIDAMGFDFSKLYLEHQLFGKSNYPSLL
jgi:hypothetical protein